MSMKSDQEKAAEQNAALQATLAQRFSNQALPEFGFVTSEIGNMLGSRDASGRLAMDAKNLAESRAVLGAGYGQAKNTSREAISYNALREGVGRAAPGAVDSAIKSSAYGLDRDMGDALRRLEFQSARTSMGNFNRLLGLSGQSVSSMLSMGSGYMGAANSALGMMNNQSEFGSVVGGASAGAGLGSSFGPWGALAGGVIGGAAGYMGSGA